MQIVRDRAQAYGLNPDELARRVQIESSGNPLATTGSYHGLLQLSPGEYARHGGTGSIYNPYNNLDAGARKMAEDNRAFSQKYGRDPTPTDSYLIHQQGEGGYAMHMAYPDRPAWKNMYMTGEGQQKGPDWARRAIWGNVPSDVRKQYPGGVENLTSRQFADIWRNKVEGSGAPAWDPAMAQASSSTPTTAGAASASATAPAASASASIGAIPGLLGTVATPGSQDTTPADQVGGMGRVMAALANQGPQLPAPPPLQLNFPTPVGLQMARIAAARGVS
jgi:hypothetical protein